MRSECGVDADGVCACAGLGCVGGCCRAGAGAGGQVVLALPLDVAWLRAPVVGQLVSWLREVSGGKALMLGGQRDPLAHFPKAVRSLQRLLRRCRG